MKNQFCELTAQQTAEVNGGGLATGMAGAIWGADAGMAIWAALGGPGGGKGAARFAFVGGVVGAGALVWIPV